MGGVHWDVPRPFQRGFEGVEGIPVCLQRGPPFHVPVHPLSSSERGAERYSRPNHRKGRHVHPYDGDAHQPGIYDQARRHSRYSFAFRDRVPGSTEGSYQPLFSLPHVFQAPEAGAPYYEAARAALHRNPGTNYIAEDAALKIGAEPSSFFTYKTKDLNEFFVTPSHPAISNGQMSFDAHADQLTEAFAVAHHAVVCDCKPCHRPRFQRRNDRARRGVADNAQRLGVRE